MGKVGGAPKDLLNVGLTRVAYHVLGLTDDIRVTAPDMDWGVLARHPHGSTCEWRKGLIPPRTPECTRGCRRGHPGPAHSSAFCLSGCPSEGTAKRKQRIISATSPTRPQARWGETCLITTERAGGFYSNHSCRSELWRYHLPPRRGGHLLPLAEPARRQPGSHGGLAWERVPGRQADGLLQEGQLWVVEAENLVHHVGLGLHRQAEHRDELASLHPEKDLWAWTHGGLVGPSGWPEDLAITHKVR